VSRSLADLTPDTRAAAERLLEFARARGLNPVIQSTARSCAEQNALFAQGPTVTRVAGCRSWHVMGRAIDVHIGSENCADYIPLAEFWKRMGGKWGGEFPGFPDCVHFELPHPDKTLAELCPDPSPGNCERAVASQPGAVFASERTLVIFGAAFGAALAMTFVGGKRRRLRTA
jgi:peptidoglycan L-alanyl-D-glutamate endopeptidase CwlK